MTFQAKPPLEKESLIWIYRYLRTPMSQASGSFSSRTLQSLGLYRSIKSLALHLMKVDFHEEAEPAGLPQAAQKQPGY